MHVIVEKYETDDGPALYPDPNRPGKMRVHGRKRKTQYGIVVRGLATRTQADAMKAAMGEKIAWGSDTALMREAARKIEAMQAREERIKEALKIAFGGTPLGVDGVLLVPIVSYNRLVELLKKV